MNPFFIFGTLFRYFAFYYTKWILLCLFGLTVIISVIQSVELMRQKSVNKTGAEEISVSVLAMLNLPNIIEVILPFAVLIGTMLCFHAWNKSNEFVVTRGFGQSIWMSLSPVLVSALAIGILFVMVINPIGAVTSKRYDSQMATLNGDISNNLTISESGIWLRDMQDDVKIIINGDALDMKTAQISNPTIYSFVNGFELHWRVQAQSIQLTQMGWEVVDGIKWDNDGLKNELGTFIIPTNLEAVDLTRSGQSPYSISIYALPHFITVLERAGLPTINHEIHFNKILAFPFLLVGISMIAARITVRSINRGRQMKLVIKGLSIATCIFIFSYLMHVMGTSLTVPALVAGWTPAIAVLLIGSIMLARLDEN
ncbi:LptF/LptG family permease [Candidatus Puniceispirillum sp.]|uniref:LptF/LptG family permease n=1 Tax=Candidatus Puniceispirillum sp. TaxID=2026719 RepID=UPI003F6A3880